MPTTTESGLVIRDSMNSKTQLRRSNWSLQQELMMAVGLGSRKAEDEEARAEVDVLVARLKQTETLNKKLEASLERLRGTGKSVEAAIGPLAGNTQNLQLLGTNIQNVLRAIEKIRKPSSITSDEEQVIRDGPAKRGLQRFLKSIDDVRRALADLNKTKLRSNQQAIADLTRLIKIGHANLETYVTDLLRQDSREDSQALNYTMKNTPFPLLAEDRKARIGMINEYMGKYARSNGQVSPMIQLYADVRGPYLKSVLENLATASVSGARRADPESIYRPGMNQIGSYAKALEGALFAEHEIITNIPFSRNDASEVFKLTCQAAVAELARTIRDLNTFIKANLTTDCFLAYEIIQVMSELSSNMEDKTGTGELKPLFASALKPIRETGRSSLAELLADVRQRVTNLPTIPADGAAVSLTTEVMTRLQVMVSFLRPVSSIMIAVGDNGWKTNTAPLVSADQVPTLNTFDVTADGKQIFAHYCIDTITTLLESLDRKAQPIAKNKSVLGVFMLNNVTIIDRMIRNSELQPLLQPRMSEIERWRKAGIKDYSGPWQDLSRQLMDVTYTRSGARPTSGSAPLIDSVAIVKALSGKEKEATKQKFTAFNNMFDELVAKHKALSMEKEVKTMLARDVQGMIEMLYHRFWDRYHEIDKGKGKYVKYDKAQITATFVSLEK